MLDWKNVSDLALSQLELARDPLAGYLSYTQRDELVAQALAAGTEAGLQLLERYGRQNPHDLARALGVTVATCKDTQMDGYRVRATYEANCITVFSSEITRTAALVEPWLGSLAEEIIVRACVAHELYHHLEETKLGLLSHRLTRATIFRLGPWRWERPVRQLREIGAHRFARVLTGLSYMPVLWDYLLILADGKVSEYDLRRQLFDVLDPVPL